MEENILVKEYHSPAGVLLVGSFMEELCLCDWRYRKKRDLIDRRLKNGLQAGFQYGNSAIIQETIRQLEEYFAKQRTQFDLPLKLIGTDFQKLVWQELIKIPFGQRLTYLDLSKRLGNEKAVRAVASANGANAISIIIPCHRIVGLNGKMVGYAGGLDAKKKLLALESRVTQGSFF
ncbi:methylated-DNA--[protein]-cysteine S-methyltransferase [Plebeiibacterium sediminum]|uniref:methylated-DNA--[protein]-cysteine S-methyltransferase n=1 Tax=Plebeiibacterium sediminum TaxID=2992112 RepID=A0AAE3M7W3_9BACT|nr:methylated-DNA--[protein]-cysteine S-methyltransferase [Plebeiobacterium sediminum]MCW3788723.1 methylated-DNA--[protein]-cysteine S-methyltransferase [Plebeiobacterium sediminum]